MTREELTMRNLIRESDVIDRTDGSELAKAFNYMWEKYVEQEPCEDAISRQGVLTYIEFILTHGMGKKKSFDFIKKYVKKQPPVTPKQKMGRWISFGPQGEIDGQIVRAFTCSECGAISIFRLTSGSIVNGGLCPNCSAKMVLASY